MDKILQKRVKYKISLIVAGIFFCLSAHAQTVNITGKVTSADDGQPIPGATIKIKGTSYSAASGADGNYSIAAAPGKTLVFSFLGFSPQEITVKQTGAINVRLNSTSSNLNEVVVIGYAKARRKDVTGSISSISGADLRQTQPTTFDQALQGKVAGVVVQQVSGQPGGGVSIQIRGVSSISGSNSPLYVIDGIIIPPVSDPGNGSNPLNSINPAEIESIDVLKDASATAIYGSQATNGVVVITTKRGKAGPPRITYDFYTGYQEIAKRLPTVDLPQLATFINARAAVWGFDARPEFANPQYLGPGTDWQKELFRKAPMMNHTLTVSGGDARTQYLLSTSYFNQEGIALGSDFKRYSLRLNLDNKTTSWLKIGTSLQLAHINENVNSTASNVISTALSLTPDVPVTNSDGSWGGVTNTNGWVQPVANPVALASIVKDLKRRNQIFGNVYAEIQFTKDLSLRNELSGNFDFNTEDKFSPTYSFGKGTPSPNSGSSSAGQNFYIVIRNFLTYNHNFNKFHIDALAGHESQESTFENVGGGRRNFPSNNVQALSAGDATTATNFGDNSNSNPTGGSAQESYFGRINFSWADKYLLTGNLRNDGSSNFPANNRWVTTYSGGFAWKINNEAFLKGVKSINELKLRLGYGLTNNQGIPGNTFVTQLASVANGLSGTAQFQNNLANPSVKWEKTDYYSAGIDGSFWNGRLGFSLDVYDRETHGLLLQVPLPGYTGTVAGYGPGSMQAPYANVGSLSNKGFDLQINSTNINSKNFTWKTSFTISRNINKVIYLGAGGSEANLSKKSYVINDIIEKTTVGQPIGEFYGYVFDGVFATPKDFQNHARPADPNGNPYPISPSGGGIWYGDRMFKDLNGDGIIDSKDQTFLGSPIPKFQYGINNTFNYKNFDLNIFFSGSYGNKVFNQMAVPQTDPQNHTTYFTSVLNYAKLAMVDPNGSPSDVNNVYVTNPNTTVVGLRNDNTNSNNRPNSLMIQDGSFLRCKNITLGYRLSESLLSKISVQSVRIYANVSNAFIITKYKGMDPEIGSWDPLQAGWDSGYYPQPRVFTIGANITLK
ncbi:TonB-linked outer membrane protein, SusC/RagA family [Mucilaginibacter gossypiicola]|uniref:TonB-linked outer membrane protein, SusC/RagA family n=1 Tax=Mucilaginibacter gossypiicola TaxID=551995 RepID=A0A1H8B9C6_9SPHI|nr:TonB-dependent receptor [Mucilaginibacter gossypiicola]SEM78457.1 TonB-linked outer membrane protein, SusC/RagA family [Mucilaginibacter gossypiicola]